jgi:hypothetical protein
MPGGIGGPGKLNTRCGGGSPGTRMVGPPGSYHSEAFLMPGSVRCPHCGHVLFAIELPLTSAVQASDVRQPDAPLLLGVPEAARLLGVLRSAIYEGIGPDRAMAYNGGSYKASSSSVGGWKIPRYRSMWLSVIARPSLA